MLLHLCSFILEEEGLGSGVMTMVVRELYLKQIRPFMGADLIKVLTGIRRSGKSALLMMIRDELLAQGIPPSRILYVNLESMMHADIRTAKGLYGYVKEHISAEGRPVIFLDEIQEVTGWEQAVNGLLADLKADLYITGSNSRLLSSELATYLAGRYVEFHIMPLSFEESIQFHDTYRKEQVMDNRLLLDRYMRLGGFPVVHVMPYSEEEAAKIVGDIYSSVILRDVVERNGLRNIDLLERIIHFTFENIGNLFSAKKISDYMKNQHRSLGAETVYSYLSYLESAFVLHRVSRFDLRGKEVLQTNEKFYVGDHGLKHAVFGRRERDVSGLLENIVYLELRRRGYQVYVGKLGEAEIDFVAEKNGKRQYLQVTLRMDDDRTREREMRPLMAIQDQYPKTIVSLETVWNDDLQGIRHIGLADFLLGALKQ